jgi:hypothetical protein
MKIPNQIALQKFYDQYRKTDEYDRRRRQTVFARLARQIILELLKKDKLTNFDLTAMIQMFGAKSKANNFFKYLEKIRIDKQITENIRNEYDEKYRGYAGTGKSAIQGLKAKELVEVKRLLDTVAHIDDIEKIKAATNIFEEEDIPQVKVGVFSAWLHYLRPDICPIVNGTIQ